MKSPEDRKTALQTNGWSNIKRSYLKGKIKIRLQIIRRYDQFTGNPTRDTGASL